MDSDGGTLEICPTITFLLFSNTVPPHCSTADNPESGDEETRLSDKLTVLVNDRRLAMRKMEYALFHGKMHKKVPSSKYTFT